MQLLFSIPALKIFSTLLFLFLGLISNAFFQNVFFNGKPKYYKLIIQKLFEVLRPLFIVSPLIFSIESFEIRKF